MQMKDAPSGWRGVWFSEGETVGFVLLAGSCLARLEVQTGRRGCVRLASFSWVRVVRHSRYRVSQEGGVLHFTLAHQLRVEAVG